ncbi:MAG: hypothetical protein AB7I50_16495 [Vicinamibacterales bacterium]
MRHVVIALALLGLSPAIGFAQGSTQGRPYGLDPFNPTDAAFLRNYGTALVSQTPLLELRHLDPFNPSDAALLRQIGGAIPLWGLAWYPWVGGVAGAQPATPLWPARARTDAVPDGPVIKVAEIGRQAPLPPVTVDPERLRELSSVPPGLAPTRVCRVVIGDRLIVC